MKRHSVRYAREHLSELIDQACAGEDVVIGAGRGSVKLVAVRKEGRKRVPGGFEGLFSWTDDAFDPLTDDEMRELGFEFEIQSHLVKLK